MRRDYNDECQVMYCSQRFEVFRTYSPVDTLYNIATIDLAEEEIRESLLNAECLGHKQFNAFFKEY